MSCNERPYNLPAEGGYSYLRKSAFQTATLQPLRHYNDAHRSIFTQRRQTSLASSCHVPRGEAWNKPERSELIFDPHLAPWQNRTMLTGRYRYHREQYRTLGPLLSGS